MNSLEWRNEKTAVASRSPDVYKIVGQIKNRFWLIAWGNNPPKESIFDRYVRFSEEMGVEFVLFVDDIAPLSVFNRTKECQERVSNLYRRYSISRGCQCMLVSEMSSNPNTVRNLMALADRFWIQDAQMFLSEEKKGRISELPAIELSHMFSQMNSIDAATRNGDCTILLAKFSAGAYYAFHNRIRPIDFILFHASR